MITLQSLSESEKNNFQDFLFYDIEVFKENTIIVFKDIDYNTKACYYNGDIDNVEGDHCIHTVDFSEVHDLIKDKCLVGYNNYHYDDIVLSQILSEGSDQKLIKATNDDIMEGCQSSPLNKELLTLDCFQQINVARSSLKKVEANIGMNIEETPIDFNIDRRLEKDELEDVIFYCSHDVTATIRIFKLRWRSYFVAKLIVTSMLPEEQQLKALRWNTTTITAQLLTKGNKLIGWDKVYLGDQVNEKPEDLERKKNLWYSTIPKEVYKNWEAQEIKKVTVKHDFLECTLEFGQGGLHGVPTEQTFGSFRNVKLLDVTSLYPNIILKINALRDSTDTYREIVEKRIAVKHTDPVLSNALKLVINATYGLMKNQYSKLLNRRGALSVCIYGQIILYELCMRLKEAGCKLININTDGVAFIEEERDEKWTFMDVKEEWENRYGFELELSEFDYWVQKDVNNYVAVKGDKVKTKGGLVNHYHDPTDYESLDYGDYAGVNWSGTNSLGIIHKVLVDIILSQDGNIRYDIYDNGIRNFIEDRVKEYVELEEPILFQYILQAGGNYLGTYDGDGNEYQKVNRVFACKGEGVTLYKYKNVVNAEGKEVLSIQLFPNAPQNMYVFNKDLKDFKEFKEIIDIDYYVDLIEEKWNLWKGIKPIK